jgi:hypothetical protein
MNTRLITSDGFPRADLDVAQSTLVAVHIPTFLRELT